MSIGSITGWMYVTEHSPYDRESDDPNIFNRVSRRHENMGKPIGATHYIRLDEHNRRIVFLMVKWLRLVPSRLTRTWIVA